MKSRLVIISARAIFSGSYYCATSHQTWKSCPNMGTEWPFVPCRSQNIHAERNGLLFHADLKIFMQNGMAFCSMQISKYSCRTEWPFVPCRSQNIHAERNGLLFHADLKIFMQNGMAFCSMQISKYSCRTEWPFVPCRSQNIHADLPRISLILVLKLTLIII